ncbi:amidase [Salinibacterium sp. SYSU T00001]|uniref:amidase n=1 Tax=Homoserinimonas sedimenticola TaxID=2986805 RepID=UPI002236369A|nr:amidase [Salinibacterium sedimenticola]MCW4385642.1 amidase [Salinibacterium sedimenticola]
MTDAIWSWTATRTAEAIRAREVSSREVTESVLARIDEVNPRVNAVVEVTGDEALAAADAADARLRSGEPLGVLHGLPVTTKINTDIAGHATTNSVPEFAGDVVDEDHPAIENLRSSGAVFVGRSNTPSFSIRWFTDNELHGRTLNPWDATRTPGGSSGGAAAAVASGMGFIAHGNDIGGSIRYPAASCGVVGLRPTPGRVPDWPTPRLGAPLLGTQQMQVQGPLARTVDDVALAFSAMAQWHPKDPFSVPVPLEGEPLEGPIRVGVVRSVGVVDLAPAVDAAITQAVESLTDAGYIVEEIDLDLFADAWRLWWQVVQGVEFAGLGKLIDQYGDDAIKKSADNQFAAMRRVVSGFELNDYVEGYTRRAALVRELQITLQQYPVLVLPISAEQTFEVDADVRDVDRMEELVKAQWPMMSIAALSVPALSVPVTVVNGLPINVQLVGRRFREDVLFDAGRSIEARASVPSPVDPR